MLKSYPKPPFPEQQQPYPGLASRMVPIPDHGSGVPFGRPESRARPLVHGLADRFLGQRCVCLRNLAA